MNQYNEQKISIKAWAEADRPREKLIATGRRNLTDAELIAILIGSGSRNETAVELSKRILHSLGNDLDRLGQLSVKELSRFKGIGQAKAITIIAALELGRRRKDAGTKNITKITTSKDVYDILRHCFEDVTHEEFWILLLNRSNNVLSYHQVSRGGQTGTVADPKIIFQTALEHHAAYIILAHNHPSGNLNLSQQDIKLTESLAAFGRLLELPVVDHLIFTNNGYTSFADRGLL